MTFKNGAKEYLLTGVLFGIPMCLLFSIYTLNIIIGLILGILSGLLFTFLIFLFSKFCLHLFQTRIVHVYKLEQTRIDTIAQ